MHAQRLSHFAAALCVVSAMLAACGGSQPPIGAPGAMPQRQAIAQHAARGKSWMLPEAKSQDLIYLSVDVNDSGYVHVYSYSSRKLVGQLTGLISAFGECTDSAGNVFVVAYANYSANSSAIYKYAHGGTNPISMLSDPGIGMGCSVDQTTGNLAVANTYDPYYSKGSVAVFSHAQGQPTFYYSSTFAQFGSCGYDDEGNLYLVGWHSSHQVGFAELPKASQSLKELSLDTPLYLRGGWIPSVQWDGSNMTVTSFPETGSAGKLLVHRLAFSGSSAAVVGTSKLLSHQHVGHSGQSWIFGNTIVGVETSGNYGKVTFWHPQGGTFTHMIKRAVSFGNAWGLTVSPTQMR